MQTTMLTSVNHSALDAVISLQLSGSTADSYNQGGRLILGSLVNSTSHTADDRWLTIITASRIKPTLWRELGVNPKHTRVIYLAREDDLLWVTWEALAAGNSHTVISLTDGVSAVELSQLHHAARTGHTRGIVLSGEINPQTAAESNLHNGEYGENQAIAA